MHSKLILVIASTYCGKYAVPFYMGHPVYMYIFEVMINSITNFLSHFFVFQKLQSQISKTDKLKWM